MNPDDPDDVKLVAELARELARVGPLRGTIAPLALFHLIGIVQLALRHPGIGGDVRRAGVAFVEHARAHFAGCPAVLEVIRRGDNPDEDRPIVVEH